VRTARTIGIALVAVAAHAASAEQRAIPFWPNSVPAAIQADVDGNAALETVREIARFHRVHGSPGYAAAADHVRRKLLAAGLTDASIERFPADGTTRYAHFVSYYGWTPKSASIEEVSPRPGPIASFPELPVALADYSQDAEVTAELVDVGKGTDASDYDGRAVRDRIVLADGALPAVHRLACEERGAAGFLSVFPNQRTAWSGEDPDLVRWGHLSPYRLANRFAFMISPRQAATLRRRLAAGEKIVLKAQVRARMRPATYDVVVATIPGTDRGMEEVALTAHLCHEAAGANDNASGSAGIFEVARALASAIRKGTLPPPRRTIRFLWLPEIAGSQAYLVRHPEVAKRLVGGVHMDMVGGLLSTTRGTFHLSRSAESVPHVVNVIAQAWFDDVVARSARYAERGEDPRSGLAWPGGSRETFLGDLRPLEMGSDHEVFAAAGFSVPMVYFHDWPDVTIHTNKDTPENLDVTKLGRVAYLGAGIAWTLAALPDGEVPPLMNLASADVDERLALSRRRSPGVRDSLLAQREARQERIEMLASLAALWPGAAGAVGLEVERLRKDPPAIPAPEEADRRVPVRSAEVRGPLGVYYYDHLAERLGEAAARRDALSRRDRGEVLAFEALNFADGKRTVSEIRDVLTGRYEAVPLSEVTAYFDLLAKAKVVTFR
jgi:aminopeptidase YwaD